MKTVGCPSDPATGESGPWNYAQLATVIGYSMDKMFPHFDGIQDLDWNYGVFYPYDSNSVDKRCRYLEGFKGYDCPGGWIPVSTGKFSADPSKLGAGGYNAGNPLKYPNGSTGGSGGGAGCHFEATGPGIDQMDAENFFHQNLVQDYHCQCNTAFRKNWDEWVNNWLANAKHKPGFEYQGWFGKGKAPSWGVDVAACWMSNPRDMIQLQNALWFKRLDWNNQMAPKSSWQGTNSPGSDRTYWGWNEVPVDRALVNNVGNWDAIVIKLPAAACGKVGSNDDSIFCLSHGAQLQLEDDLNKYISKGYLTPGADKYTSKPGSSIVFVREIIDVNGNYQKEFYCQGYTTARSKYDIVFVSDKGPGKEGTGSCYIQYHSASEVFV